MDTLSSWDKFWVWLNGSYIYQTAVIGFILGYILFGLFKVTKFHFGKDGINIERDSKVSGAAILERLKKIEGEINEIKKTLNVHYQFIRNAVVEAGIGVAWSDKGAPYDETIRALLMNISLGEDGNHEKRLVEVVIGKGKGGIEDYHSIKNKFIRENKEHLNEYFYSTIAKIELELK